MKDKVKNQIKRELIKKQRVHKVAMTSKFETGTGGRVTLKDPFSKTLSYGGGCYIFRKINCFRCHTDIIDNAFESWGLGASFKLYSMLLRHF